MLPGMSGKGVFPIRLEMFHELAPLLSAEARADSNVLQGARIVEETQQQGTHKVAIPFLVPAKPCHHAIAVAFVFDFEHHAFVGLVSSGNGFGHHAIEARTLKATKPIGSHAAVAGCGSQMDRWRSG